MRLYPRPQPHEPGSFGTYLVPAGQLCAFWVEGRVPLSASLAWSYVHTHPAWTKEMLLYVGATGAQLDMAALYPSGAALSSYSPGALANSSAQLSRNAAQVGAALVCRLRRDRRLADVPNGAYAEYAGNFYRAALGCVPFHLRKGMPWVSVVVTAADSAAAATAHADDANPQWAGIGALHTNFRLFVHVENATRATWPLYASESGLPYGSFANESLEVW